MQRVGDWVDDWWCCCSTTAWLRRASTLWCSVSVIGLMTGDVVVLRRDWDELLHCDAACRWLGWWLVMLLWYYGVTETSFYTVMQRVGDWVDDWWCCCSTTAWLRWASTLCCSECLAPLAVSLSSSGLVLLASPSSVPSPWVPRSWRIHLRSEASIPLCFPFPRLCEGDPCYTYMYGLIVYIVYAIVFSSGSRVTYFIRCLRI